MTVSLCELHEKAMSHCEDIYTDSYLSIQDSIVNDDTDMQCFFKIEDEKLFIVFRGSDSLMDWKMNFYMTQSEYPRGSDVWIHNGFLCQWLSIEKEFKEKLTSYLDSNIETKQFSEIVSCGHSSGNGHSLVSTYACKDIYLKYGIPVKVITFAGPKCGNIHFKNSIEEFADCTRIVLDRDAVTRVPLLYNYEHIGKPIQLRDDCILERDTSSLEHIHWLLLGLKHGDLGLLDHAPWNYKNAITMWLHKLRQPTGSASQ